MLLQAIALTQRLVECGLHAMQLETVGKALEVCAVVVLILSNTRKNKTQDLEKLTQKLRYRLQHKQKVFVLPSKKKFCFRRSKERWISSDEEIVYCSFCGNRAVCGWHYGHRMLYKMLPFCFQPRANCRELLCQAKEVSKITIVTYFLRALSFINVRSV